MALLNDSLEIRLSSPDYQEDWGVLGDPSHVVLTKVRSTADLLEIGIDADSPQRELVMREMCGVRVRFRGKVEFVGHIYQRRGPVVENDAEIVVYARSEDEVFDHTLAWVVPDEIRYSGSWGNLYSSGKIEPEAARDSAQGFPDPWMDPGHYMWAWPYTNTVSWTWRRTPQMVGEFIGPLLERNLKRVGYQRGTLFSGDMLISGYPYFTTIPGAPYTVVDETDWAYPTTPPPWRYGFAGVSPRFQTLREVVSEFQAWADQATDRSFNLFTDGEIGAGSYGIRVGYRQGPPPYPMPLSVASGTIIDGEWSVTDHQGSRIILGGPGEQEQRLFQERRQVSRETTGRVIEVFKDATGAKLMTTNQNGYEDFPRYYFVDPTVPDGYKDTARRYFDQQGDRYLTEAGPETSAGVTLQETENVFYGGDSGYQIGQKVTLDLGWTRIEKRIEKVVISLTRSEGLTVVPQVGSELSTADEEQARALSSLAAWQRRDNAER